MELVNHMDTSSETIIEYSLILLSYLTISFYLCVTYLIVDYGSFLFPYLHLLDFRCLNSYLI